MITISFDLEKERDRAFVMKACQQYEYKRGRQPDLVDQVEGETSIKQMWMTARCENALFGEGITTIEQLLPLNEVQLLKIINIGKKSLREILAARQLYLDTGMTEQQRWNERKGT